eukprot:116663-Ditylum_brightwellii.AAC.1
MQWQVIGCLSVALVVADDDNWERSFKAVNLHPHHCVLFEDWLKKIADHVEKGEQLFKKDAAAMLSSHCTDHRLIL